MSRVIHVMRDGRWLRPLDPSTDLLFWLKVEGGDVSECWTWIGSRDDKGYGRCARVYGTVHAHRYAYSAMRAEIPAGLELDHLCRNPSCVNPWHLEPVTPLVNNRRGLGNASKTTCPRGHAYDATTMGRRVCSRCRRDAVRRHYARQRAELEAMRRDLDAA